MTARDVIAKIDVEFEHEGEWYAFSIGKENADIILTALEAAGCKLLSREPTEAMLANALLDASTIPDVLRKNVLRINWRKMFDAAPTAKDKP